MDSAPVITSNIESIVGGSWGYEPSSHHTAVISPTAMWCLHTESKALVVVITCPVVPVALDAFVDETPSQTVLSDVAGVRNGYLVTWLHFAGE